MTENKTLWDAIESWVKLAYPQSSSDLNHAKWSLDSNHGELDDARDKVNEIINGLLGDAYIAGQQHEESK